MSDDPDLESADEGRPRESGRRRLAPEARRAEILDAALRVFVDMGFERATLQDVADRAGVTKGALYHYFDSKDMLFSELIRERLGARVSAGDARVGAADRDLAPEARLEAYIRDMWSDLQQREVLELAQLVMTELPKFPELGHAFFEDVVVPARRTMRRLWAPDALPGATAEEIDAIVAILPSMVFGAALTQRLFAGIDPLRLAPAIAGDLITRMLVHGLPTAASRSADPRR